MFLIIFILLLIICILFSDANEYLLFISTLVLLFVLFWNFNFSYKTQFVIICFGFFFAFAEYIAVNNLQIWTYSSEKSYFVVPMWLIPAWGIFCIFSWILINWAIPSQN